MRRGWARATSLGLFCFLVSCAGPPPRPPTSVIDADPEILCAGDEFATPLRISGARSSAALSLVPGPPDPDAAPLEYGWALDGAAYRVLAGDLGSRELTLTTSGDRPLHVTLTVYQADGGEATTRRTIGLFDPHAPCGESCPEGSTCVADLCVPDVACAADDECPLCFACDLAGSTCVPGSR